jgi:glutathione synthase/RimK-type ligase-like ATP-grasp enzyme
LPKWAQRWQLIAQPLSTSQTEAGWGGQQEQLMLNSQRAFVDALNQYCARHGIEIEIRSQGWLIGMRRGAERRFAFGYDVGLNSAVSHRIANDKAAAAEVLQISGVPCVPHTLFLSPRMSDYVPPQRSWEAMIALLERNPNGIVVKPNEGTSGEAVFKVLTAPDLEVAVHKIFSSSLSLAISPYLDIESEVRVVLMDGRPLVVYSKSRPEIVGDGKRTLLQLAHAAALDQRSTLLRAPVEDFDSTALDAIPALGQRVLLNWRHNLDLGARPIVLEQGSTRDACVAIALQAAEAIDIRFASVDVVQVSGFWRILEINSGVMMEALARTHPELVYAAYATALDKVFEQSGSADAT